MSAVGARRGTVLYIGASSKYFILHHIHLARAAAKQYEVRAALALDDAGDRARLEAEGIGVFPLRLSRGTANPLEVFGEAAALRRIVKAAVPDIVNAIGLKSVLVGAIALYGLPGTFIGAVTGLGYLFSGDGLKRRALRGLTFAGLRRTLGGRAGAFIFSNRDDRGEFLRRGVELPGGMPVIPIPGVDPAEFVPTPEPREGFRVALAGRMLREKGIEDFVEAARLFKRRVPEAEFILAGLPDAANPTSLDEAQLRRWDRECVITWLGHHANMPELLASCHVVCLPSYYGEGLPRVLMEALACGRPIVAADVPGCRDIVKDTDAGLLVPARDPEALVAALTRLRQNRDERLAMGRLGREAVEKKFAADVVADAVLKCYEAALALGTED